MMDVGVYNTILALGTLLGQILVAVFLISLLIYRRGENPVLNLVGKYGAHIAFVTVLGATVTSLIYSGVYGYAPCKLCWYQRVFLYPQVVILGLALWKKDVSAYLYATVLSVIGILVSIYQTLLQYGLAPEPCSAIEVSCSRLYVMMFGYISIPVMALTAFALILVSLYATRARN